MFEKLLSRAAALRRNQDGVDLVKILDSYKL